MFVRPWFLILLIVPILFYFWHKKTGALNPWDKVIDKELQPFLLVRKGAAVIRRRFWTFGFLWTLLSVAAAGPYVSFEETPAETRLPANVIVLDLSPVTDAARLNIARVKMQELLNNLQVAGEQVGLVLSDTAGYVAVPVTPDTGLIRETALTIKPGLLPTPGSNPAAGIDKAAELLKRAGASKGRIFLITPGGFDAAAFLRQVRSVPYQIGILGIGEEGQGAPIAAPQGGFLKDDSGRLITAGLNPDVLKQAGVYVLKTPDASDVQTLLTQTRSGGAADGVKADVAVRVPHDLGPWFVLAALPFMAFLFRRGVFFVWMLVGLVSPAWADAFQRPDQVAYTRMRQGQALFQNGSYAESAAVFETMTSDEALYNRATAMAHAGDLSGAIDLYDRLLKRHPDHADGAFNKAYLEKLMAQQNPPPEESDKSDKNSDPKEENSSGQRQEQNQQNAADSDQANGEKEQNGPSADADSESPAQQDAMPDKEAGALADEKESGTAGSGVPALQAPAGAQEGLTDSRDSSEQGVSVPQEKDSFVDAADSGAETIPQPVYEAAPESETNKEATDGFVRPESVDQETQQLFNRIRQDPSRVLRYRLYRQYQRQQVSQATGRGEK